MIKIGEEQYLLATEAARYLQTSRTNFYKKYKRNLQAFKVGQLEYKHYRLSDLEQLNNVEVNDEAA